MYPYRTMTAPLFSSFQMESLIANVLNRVADGALAEMGIDKVRRWGSTNHEMGIE